MLNFWMAAARWGVYMLAIRGWFFLRGPTGCKLSELASSASGAAGATAQLEHQQQQQQEHQQPRQQELANLQSEYPQPPKDLWM
jgi:hypothetical protein